MSGLYGHGRTELGRLAHLVRPAEARSLCGYALTGVGHDDPDGLVCQRCLRIAEREAETVCPACWGPAEITYGRVEAHPEWRVNRDGMRQTAVRCAGSGAVIGREQVAAC